MGPVERPVRQHRLVIEGERISAGGTDLYGEMLRTENSNSEGCAN